MKLPNLLWPSWPITDFSPFVFQILSQMLELHANHSQVLPEYYISLLQPLLTPNLWEVRGNIPALVRLLRAYLSAGSKWIVEGNRVSGMLGVFQKLIGSKLNDTYGFELLQALLEHIPMLVSPFNHWIISSVYFTSEEAFVSSTLGRTFPRICAMSSSSCSPAYKRARLKNSLEAYSIVSCTP